MIKKIVSRYLHKIALKYCRIYDCCNCPFGCKNCICSILKVERILNR